MLVKTEYLPQAEPSHDGESYAIRQAQMPAGGGENSCYALSVIRFGYPFHMNDRNNVFYEPPRRIDANPVLQNSERLKNNVVMGNQRCSVFNHGFPYGRGFPEVGIVGVKEGEKSRSVDEYSHFRGPLAQ